MVVGRSVHSVSYIDFGAQGGIGICQNCHHIIAKYCETFETIGKASMEIFINSANPTLPHNLNRGVDLDVVNVL